MMTVGFSAGLTVNLWETSVLMNSNFGLIETEKVHLTYELGRATTTFGMTGLIMLFCRSRWLPAVQRALGAVGRMALTNYIMHTLITSIVFVGFSHFGLWQRHQLYYLVGGIWIFQILLSPLWLSYFHFGPLEWLWRSLTYGKRPAMLRIRQTRTT